MWRRSREKHEIWRRRRENFRLGEDWGKENRRGKEGKTKKIRELIERIPEDERDSADWYNLGLAYEASALSPEDYEDARRFYIYALEKKPGTKIYAQGVGRTRSYLAETRKLAKQLQN